MTVLESMAPELVTEIEEFFEILLFEHRPHGRLFSHKTQ